LRYLAPFQVAASTDITLVIHFDTSSPAGDPNGLNPKGYDSTKVYVAGGFELGEFASRDDRMLFARHLLNPRAWDASVLLGRNIVRQFGDQLGILPDPQGGDKATKVEPGILRSAMWNAFITMRLASSRHFH
jgi:hypothetical protein